MGLVGVRVDVVEPTNHAVVHATTTSGGDGTYSVSVAPGTYDVVYTPSGTTYEPTTRAGVNLSTSTTIDVVLVLAPRTFAGTVRDAHGVAIPGVVVSLHGPSQSFSTTTAANGGRSASTARTGRSTWRPPPAATR